MIVFDLTDDLLAEFDDEVSTHLPTVAMAREIRRRRAAETTVPPAIQDGIDRYCRYGLPPGDCLRWILEGDLYRALYHADAVTKSSISAIVHHITATMAPSIYGSPEAVSRYLASCQKLSEA